MKTLVEANLSEIYHLLQTYPVIQITGPNNSGANTALPIYLKDSVVVVSSKAKANSLKVYTQQKYNQIINYVSSKDWENIQFKSYLIMDDIYSADAALIMALWNQKRKPEQRMIILNKSPNRFYLGETNLFSDVPIFHLHKPISPVIEVRYTHNYSDYYSSEQDIVNLAINLNLRNENAVIYTIGKEAVNSLTEKLVNNNVNAISVYKYKSEKSGIIYVTDQYINFPNIGYIIDSMREIQYISTITGGYRHKHNYISKSEANSRADIGNSDKIVYRMISEADFNGLKTLTNSQIFYKPLYHSVIDLYQNKQDPYILSLYFQKSDIDFVIKTMLEHGLLNMQYKVTMKGRNLRKMVFGMRLAILFADWYEKHIAYPGLVMVALIDSYIPNIYIYPENSRNKQVFDYQMESLVHNKDYFDRFRGDSDVESLLNIYTSMISEESDLEEWARTNYISEKYLRDVRDVVKHTMNVFNFDESNIDVMDTIEKSSELFENIYPDRKMYLNEEETIYTNYDGYKIDSESVNTVEEKRPLEIYGIVTSEIKSEYENFKNVSVCYVSPKISDQKMNEANQSVIIY